MTEDQKPTHSFSTSVPMAVGGVGFIFTVAGSIISLINYFFPFYDLGLDKKDLVIIGALSVLLFEAGFERMKQRNEVESKIKTLSDDFRVLAEDSRSISRDVRAVSNDFEKLKHDFLQIPSFQVIEGHESVTDDTIKEIKNADRIIRVTSFKDPNMPDTPLRYYSALGSVIRAKKIRLTYRCCFNEGANLTNRIKAFKQLKFTDDEYKKMFYYKFQGQNYLNLMIIDENVVFIGFPMQSLDEHIQIALKIKADNSEMARDFIKSLINWYENVLLENKDKFVPTNELLK